MSVQLLSIRDVAERLSVSKSTVERMLKRGEIPYLQMNGLRRVDLRDLERWLDATKGVIPIPDVYFRYAKKNNACAAPLR